MQNLLPLQGGLESTSTSCLRLLDAAAAGQCAPTGYRPSCFAVQLPKNRLQEMATLSVAVVEAVESILYRELEGSSSRIASYLKLPGGEDWAEMLLASAKFGVGSARCDIVEDAAQEWRILEVNATNAGGWIASSLSQCYGNTEDECRQSEGAFDADSLDTAEQLFEDLSRELLKRATKAPRTAVNIGIVVSMPGVGEFDQRFVMICRRAAEGAAGKIRMPIRVIY